MAKPVPADNELPIRISATTVGSPDWRVRSLALPAGFGPFGRLAFGLRATRQRVEVDRHDDGGGMPMQ